VYDEEFSVQGLGGVELLIWVFDVQFVEVLSASYTNYFLRNRI